MVKCLKFSISNQGEHKDVPSHQSYSTLYWVGLPNGIKGEKKIKDAMFKMAGTKN